MGECSTCTTNDDLREARERAANLSVELAAMTQTRDELRQALGRAERDRDRAERDRDQAERKGNELRERAWRAENSLTIMALKQGKEGAR